MAEIRTSINAPFLPTRIRQFDKEGNPLETPHEYKIRGIAEVLENGAVRLLYASGIILQQKYSEEEQFTQKLGIIACERRVERAKESGVLGDDFKGLAPWFEVPLEMVVDVVPYDPSQPRQA